MRLARPAWLVVSVLATLLVAAILPNVLRTAPQAAAPGQVRFTASGDFDDLPEATAVFNQIASIGPDLHLALGDLSYGTTGQEQAWCDKVVAGVGAGFPFELISGNHEMNGLNGNINEFSACLPNQLPGLVGVYGREWYVDVPQTNPLVRFIMISPNLTFTVGGNYSYATGSPHYNWTAAAIDGARTRAIPWVVVGAHYPCITAGEKACESGAAIQNLLLSKKVDLVLHGHEHLYQRSKQLSTGPNCPAVVPGTFDSDCVVDGDTDLAKGAGTVFVTAGTGGQLLRPVNLGDAELPYFAAWSGQTPNGTWGSLDVTATADTLTASFARAAGGTFTDSFTIRPPANVPPVARFTSSCTAQLACSFNGSTSTDSDGTVTGYAWDFGDGAVGTGITANRTYATPATYQVRLTVTDDDGAQHAVTQPVTVGPPPNVPPTASFTLSCTALNCAMNGSASSDPDGTIAAYAWDFGDGTTGSGATPNHTFAAPGSYTVRLTVTDNAGAPGTTTSVAQPTTAPAAIASDSFQRDVSNGLGTADVGGAWTLTGGNTNFSVSGGLGRIRLPAGSGPSATLPQVSSASTDFSLTVATDKPVTGSGLYISAIGRRVLNQGDYRAKARLTSTGAVALSLNRTNSAGTETAIQTEMTVSGLQYVVGDRLALRVQVTGTNPTTIRSRIWKVGTPEPATWQRSVTDTTAALQAPGQIGILTYLSSSATNAPIVLALDDLQAATP